MLMAHLAADAAGFDDADLNRARGAESGEWSSGNHRSLRRLREGGRTARDAADEGGARREPGRATGPARQGAADRRSSRQPAEPSLRRPSEPLVLGPLLGQKRACLKNVR
jgi:hypothetical protein